MKFSILRCLAYAACLFPLLAWSEERLVILSPHWEGIRYEFEEAFKERYLAKTGQSLSFVWLDVGATSQIVRFVESQFEHQPSGIGVDLVFGGGTDPYEEFKRKGLLFKQRLPDQILKDVPADLNGAPLYDPDFYWYAPTMSVFGIMCNNPVLKRLGLGTPATWEDLTDRRYFSWVSLADPRKSGSAHMGYEIILQAYGWERGWRILSGMAANSRAIVAYGSQIPKDVSDGEIACGLTIDSNAWAQIRTLEPGELSFIVPKDATIINGDALAILKGAPNLKAAVEFVEFMMTAEAQKKWVYRVDIPGGPRRYTLSRLSVLPSLYANESDFLGKSEIRLNPFSWKTAFRYDAQKGSARWNILNDLIGVFLIENHRSLAKSGRQLTAPLSEDEVTKLAKSHLWQDSLAKNEIIKQWKAQAKTLFPERGSLLQWVPLALALLLALRVMGRRKKWDAHLFRH